MKDGELLRKYRYDVFGNRTGLVEGTMEKHYGYNALNQLIGEVDSMAERENKKKFCYDKRGNLIEILLNGRLEDQYSYGALNRLEYAKNAAGMVEEDFSHKLYLQDEMGSPLRLVDVEGNLQESYSYDEFGRDLYPDGMQTQPFDFTGYQADHVAGTYFAQAREYMPSAGRFVSRDADKFISIGNMQSINLYQCCMSNPVRYIDPSGNDLEDLYPLSRNSINDAVQIKISGNEIRIDVYVDFEGNERLTTANGTPCKDLAVAGIENWSKNYLDVFGENVTVSVNVHEKNMFSPLLHRYIKINLEEGGFAGICK